MRLILAIVAASLLAPAFVSAASTDEPRDAMNVTTVRLSDTGVHVVWTAAPGALSYDVYRGPSLDKLERIAATVSLEYTDLAAPDAELWYEVLATSGHVDDDGPMRGRCIAMRSTGVALTIANCMPSQGPVEPVLPQL